jgi:hypothetical protein
VTQPDSQQRSVGPFDPDELVHWAEMYGHPEDWCKKAQQLHGRLERLHHLVVSPGDMGREEIRDAARRIIEEAPNV